MTVTELLARVSQHEALAAEWRDLIEEEAAVDEADDPWSAGWVGSGALPPAPGKRHDARHLREAERNEAEVYVGRVSEHCELARQAIDMGDVMRAAFHEYEASQTRRIVEPMIADIQLRATSRKTGAQGGKRNRRPISDKLIRAMYEQQMTGEPKLSFQEATRRVYYQLKADGFGLSHSAIKARLRKR